MKTKHLSILGAGAMLLGIASCANNIDDVENPNLKDGEVSYISVNLVANHPGTRAEEPGLPEGAIYEDGNETENAVNKVRFYFFNELGAAFPVQADGTSSYYDALEPTDAGQDMPNVEKILTTTATIVTDGENFPSQVIVVLNPSTEVMALTRPSISELNAAVYDFSSTTNGFVMSNSVYLNQTEELQEAVSIGVEDFYTTPEAALADPVVIYVERVLAKVSLDISDGLTSHGEDAEGRPLYDTGVTYNGQPVYVKFLGWNVTATAQTSNLMKNINPEWAPDLFGTTEAGISEPWNYAPYFRSFWAANPANLGIGYGNFNGEDNMPSAQALTAFSATAGNNYTYLQENAANDFTTGAGSNHPSQVIIAAQLCNASGEALPFAEWAFGKYTIDGLYTAYLAQLALHKGQIYIKNDNTYTQLKEQDIEFKTAGSINSNLMSWTEKGRYYVYPQLVDPNLTYTIGTGDGAVVVSGADVDRYLRELGPAKVWEGGNTYYYFTIRHLGASLENAGYYGVVRNHVYKATIETLTGLGTPVYDPDEIIYPEKPEDEDGYIAAKINILSWRVVSQGVGLNW